MKRSVSGTLVAASAIALAVSIASPAWSQSTAPEDAAAASNDDILVMGRMAERMSSSSTGMNLTLRQTPQSVTIIDEKRIKAFALTTTADVINQAVGVNVEKWETDRANFTSRGFDVTNFQIDGIGLPLPGGLNKGEQDTFLYDRVDIIRGANGMRTGIGNPSATINFIRKRPLDTLQVQGGVYLGSYDKKRIEADASVPLDAEGRYAIRVLGVYEDRDDSIDLYRVKRAVGSITASAKLTDELKATVGYYRHENHAFGASYGSPLQFYSDGTRIERDRSRTSAPKWAKWPNDDDVAFGELAYKGERWDVTGIVMYHNFQGQPRISYVFGFPDKTTGLGSTAYTAQFDGGGKRYYGDLYASGKFDLFGREHQLTMGVSWARSHEAESSSQGDYGAACGTPGAPVSGCSVFGANQAYGALPDFRSPELAVQPAFGPYVEYQNFVDKQYRAYIATQINIADPFKVIAGVSATKIKRDGFQNNTMIVHRSDDRVSPYIGALFDATRNITFYASYTDTFTAQNETDQFRNRLGPVVGSNMEAGIKGEWFGGKLYTVATVYKVKMKGIAAFAGNFVDANGPFTAYVPTTNTAKGFELEVNGNVTSRWQISGGYSGLKIEDETGADTRTFMPRKSLKMATTYSVPEIRNLTFGAQFRYQSKISQPVSGFTTGATVDFTQGAYSVIDLMTSIDVIDGVRATLNVRNINNAKYINSLYYGTGGAGFYGAGRNVVGSITFKF